MAVYQKFRNSEAKAMKRIEDIGVIFNLRGITFLHEDQQKL